MYKRNAQGWSKHMDFVIIDILSLQIAFILAAALRHRWWAYAHPLYRTMGLLTVFIDLTVLIANDSLRNVVKRGPYAELLETLKHCFFCLALMTVFMFATQAGDDYSRIIVFLTAVFHTAIGYGMRIFWKRVLRDRGLREEKKSSLLVVTSPDGAEEILDRLIGDYLAGYRVTGVILTEDSGLPEIRGIPVVAGIGDAADYIMREWVDSVYIDAPLTDARVAAVMDACAQMAVPTHYRVPDRYGEKRFSEKMGGTTVLTASVNYVTPLQAWIKRGFDILAGLLGSLAALIIMAVVAPIIRRQSPGCVLFSQERVGLNGKHFRMYKIRSMHMDAEEQKSSLMDQNRVADGLMFKLDFDPRIIGNEILPDGTKKTGIGEFIRRTSLDEFPQFFCVLKGDMSVVGTRPPTPDEYARYQLRHRARMAIRPGITGMWQVNGRSRITDFEEVVRLDTEYISDWSLTLDLKILLKTVAVWFSGKGAM